MRPILVSACLLGLFTRYDGASKHHEPALRFIRDQGLVPIPVCPEQLAGLPTPRPSTRFACGDGEAVLDGNGKVMNAEGKIVNETFLHGAIETMKIARLAGCTQALLKERSPSCGVHQVYLEDRIVAGQGVTAALLARNGLDVFSEEDL
jgi:uncharacterized protein YbbK (DUF523 family)